MVDRPDLAPPFSGTHRQKPDCLFIGSVDLGFAASLADLLQYADRAETAGCHAIRVAYRRPGSFFAASRAESGTPDSGCTAATRVEEGCALEPADIEELAHRCLDRLAVAVSVYNLSGLADTACLDGIAMLAVPAPAATDPQLVARAAETGLRTLLDVNLLSAATIETASSRFSPGQLTLMWNQIAPRASVLETVEDLFALIRLRQYGLPVGYGGVARDPLAIAVAIGFGAMVLDVPLNETGRKLAWEVADLSGFLDRLRRAQDEPDGELLRASDLDLVDELRPCLVAARQIRRGETLTAEMIACKAPFRGLSPRLLPVVLSRRVLYDIAQDEPLTFGLLDV